MSTPSAGRGKTLGAGYAALVLAAGQSKRFGAADKRLAEFGGVPLLRHVLQRVQCLGFDHKICVVNENPDIKGLVRAAGFTVIENPMPEEGMASSLRLGVQALMDGQSTPLRGLLVFNGDMPFWSVDDVKACLRAFKASGDAGLYVRPYFKTHPGHPVLFGFDLVHRLAQLSGGEKPLSALSGLRRIACLRPDDGCSVDIDTVENLEAAHRRLGLG